MRPMSIPAPIEVASERSGEFKVQERRVHARVAISLRVIEVDGDVRYFQYASNISESGMFLEGAAPRDPGSLMTLLFIPPGSREPMTVLARVIGNLEAPRRGIRVRFLADDDSAIRTWLREYVRHRHAAA